MILCLNIALPRKHIAFALKRIGKLYSKKQHLVIVKNNHIAGTGLAPVSDGFIQKRSRRQPLIKLKGNLIFNDNTMIINLATESSAS